jgi:dephospho-CoA kinase
MKLYGLTGGIGAGKSAAAELLRNRGVMVIDTDQLARQLVEPGQPALVEIVSRFGNGVLLADHLDRRALARLVFADETARKDLEAILHPRIRQAWQAETERWRQQGSPVGVVVIPLLYETAAEASFDAVICLACSAETQKHRLYQRGWSDAEIAERLSSQWPLEKKMNKASYVVWNEGDLDTLGGQLDRIIPQVKPADYFLEETENA